MLFVWFADGQTAGCHQLIGTGGCRCEAAAAGQRARVFKPSRLPVPALRRRDRNLQSTRGVGADLLREYSERRALRANNLDNVFVLTAKHMEASDGQVEGMKNNVAAAVAALEAAGIIFIDSNGNGPGVRLRERQ